MFHDDPSGLAVTLPAPSPRVVEATSWRLSDVIVGSVLLVFGFAATIALGVGLALRGPIDRTDAMVALLLTVVTLLIEVWAGVIVIGLALSRRISLHDLGFRPPSSWMFVPLAVFGAYGSIIVYGLVVMAIERLTGADLASLRQGNRIPPDLPRTPLIWGTLGLAVMVAAPFCEELFFRGLIYRGLAGIGGPVLGIIVSGLAFSAVHANLSVVVPFALIGMTFAWVYRASGSLWPTMVAHAIVNGVSFVYTLYGVAS